MKNLVIIAFIFSLVILNFRVSESQTKEEKQAMIKLVKDIVKSPPRMLETMGKNKLIDCSKMIQQFKKDSWRLISFTMKITRLKCMNFKYDGFVVDTDSKTNEKMFEIYYIKNNGNKIEDIIRFNFYTEDNKIIF